MNRRNALKGLAAGLAAFPGLVPHAGDTDPSAVGKLFPTDLPLQTPTQFAAEGFRQPATTGPCYVDMVDRYWMRSGVRFSPHLGFVIGAEGSTRFADRPEIRFGDHDR